MTLEVGKHYYVKFGNMLEPALCVSVDEQGGGVFYWRLWGDRYHRKADEIISTAPLLDAAYKKRWWQFWRRA